MCSQLLPIEKDGIVYRLATAADEQALYDLSMSDFFPRMPLHSNPPAPAPPELVTGFLRNILQQGVSLLAEDASSGEVVGGRLNALNSTSGSFEMPQPDGEVPEEYRRSWQVLELIEAVESPVDCLKLFKQDRALSFKMLVVKESHGRRGIGRKLDELAIDLARERGIRLVTGSTESNYSQRINEKLGFQVVHRIAYRDYVDPKTGEKPFANMEATVHKEAVMFAKLID